MSTKTDGEGATVFLEVGEETPARAEGAPSVIDQILEGSAPSPAPSPAPRLAPPPSLSMARLVSLQGSAAEIVYRGRSTPVSATIDPIVDRSLIAEALQTKNAVLVEVDPAAGAVIVGVVQTRRPEVLELKARKIVIEAEDEVLLRSGRGALRMRDDGDVELVGSRISTMSRGLFRVVGRILRLN